MYFGAKVLLLKRDITVKDAKGPITKFGLEFVNEGIVEDYYKMNTVKRIGKNITVLLVSQVAGYILTFFYMMSIARYLGPASFGILSFARAFAGIFGVLTDFGLHQLTVREVARDKSLVLKYLANVSLMKIILVAITFGLVVLTINLLGYPEQTIKVVYLVALSVVFDAFTQMFHSIFKAYERMEFQAICRVLNTALMLGGVILAIKVGFSVVGFGFLFFLASVVVLVYSFVILRWKLSNPPLAWSPRRMEIDWSFWKPTIKEALLFGLSSIFVNIYYWIDSVMLSLMKGDVVVGWYNAAYRLILILMFIPAVLQCPLFPVTSRLFRTQPESLKFSCERFFKYMLIIGLPIATGTCFLADRIILLVFQAEYTASIISLQILIWGVMFAFIAIPFENLFYSINKQHIVTLEVGIGAVLNVVMNLLLIPKYSYIGASIATIAVWIFEFLFLFIWISKTEYKMPNKVTLNVALKVFVASAVMTIFVVCLKSSNLLILVMGSAAIYFGFLYLIRGFDDWDVSMLKELIHKGPV